MDINPPIIERMAEVLVREGPLFQIRFFLFMALLLNLGIEDVNLPWFEVWHEIEHGLDHAE